MYTAVKTLIKGLSKYARLKSIVTIDGFAT